MLEPQIRLRNSIILGNLNLTKKLLTRFAYLIEDIDPTNGWTPLHYAAYHGHYLVVVLLLSLMTSLDELEGIPKTFIKETPIHLCCYKGHEQVLHLLLQHYPHHMNVGGGESLMTPLHICAKYDYFKCIELLIGLKVDVNSKDSGNETPLHYAMKFGNINSIMLLVNNGSEVNAYSDKKLRPADVARSFDIEKFLNKLVDASKRRSTISSLNSPNSSHLESSTNKSPYQYTSASPEDLNLHQQNLYRNHSNSLPPLPTVTTVRKNSLIPQSNSPRSPSNRKKQSRNLSPIQTGNLSSASTNYYNDKTLPSPLVKTPIASVSYTFQANSSNDSTPLSANEQSSNNTSITYPNMGSYHLTERDISVPKQGTFQLPSIKSAISFKQQHNGSSSSSTQSHHHQRRNSCVSKREYKSDSFTFSIPTNRSRSNTITPQQFHKIASSSSFQSQQLSSQGNKPTSSHNLPQPLNVTKTRSNSDSSKLSVVSRTSTESSSSTYRATQNIGRISSPTLQNVGISASLYRKESNVSLLDSFGINEDMRQKYASGSSSKGHAMNSRRGSLSTVESEGVITEHNSRLLARSYSSGGMRSTSSGSGTGTSGNVVGRKILNINISSLSSRRGN